MKCKVIRRKDKRRPDQKLEMQKGFWIYFYFLVKIKINFNNRVNVIKI